MENELIPSWWGDWRILRNIATQVFTVPTVLQIRIQDPVPFWPRDPGWVKNQDPDPEYISESLVHIFWVKNT
jgi:hypothetical protein